MQLATLSALAALLSFTAARDTVCPCGYLDPVTGSLWTDSTIIYFNETTPEAFEQNPDWTTLNFENSVEAGYDVVYRQGADAANVGYNGTGEALALKIEAPGRRRVITGGGIRTARQDIQFGTFRANLQPAGAMAQGGSALSMYYRYNESHMLEVDLLTGDPRGLAQAQYRISAPSQFLAPVVYNFTDIATDITEPQQLYQMNEYRIDWLKNFVSFGNNLNATAQRNMTWKDKYVHGPSVPGAVFFKHWSTGAPTYMRGPPMSVSYGFVGYVRLFYNSTISSGDDVFGAQCRILDLPTCSTDDETLRTSSEFDPSSALRWKNIEPKYRAPRWAVYGGWSTFTLFMLILIHALVRRWVKYYSIPKEDRPVIPPAYAYKLDRFELHGELTSTMIKEKKKQDKADKKAIKRGETPVIRSREIDPDTVSLNTLDQDRPDSRANSIRGFKSLSSNKNAKAIAAAMPKMYYSRPGDVQGSSRERSRLAQTDSDEQSGSQEDNDQDYEDYEDGSDVERDDEEDDQAEDYGSLNQRDSTEVDRRQEVAFVQAPVERKKSLAGALAAPAKSAGRFWQRLFRRAAKTPGGAATTVKDAPVIQVSARFDYLDGLRGLCCLLVSLVHYCLTFYHGMIATDFSPTGDHYSWLPWIRYTISPLFFNANFGIGVFFVLSSRLIGVRYLKTGSFSDLAGSTFRRIPRLGFPVICAVVLEYFLLGVGATTWLQYLASVTWSTWAYAIQFKNMGWFINETIALFYVTPPQLPAIIYNYCTGVLWTIPVSIQGSWLIFLGVIVIKEIRTPWKRFGYYFVCMLCSWYALNWGAYFWVGLAISDLDFTYKYRQWFARPARSWAAILSLTAIFLLFMSSQYVMQVSYFNLSTFENAIHPDVLTGRPIGQTERYGFPEFMYPQVHSLFAATALLLLCDLAPSLQAILRIKFLRVLGFYSYSIYLLHGVVFWSWGAWLTILLSTHGMPYWANQIIVFITSYILMAVAVALWTPFADVFAMYLGTALWRWAQGRAHYATIG